MSQHHDAVSINEAAGFQMQSCIHRVMDLGLETLSGLMQYSKSKKLEQKRK